MYCRNIFQLLFLSWLKLLVYQSSYESKACVLQETIRLSASFSLSYSFR